MTRALRKDHLEQSVSVNLKVQSTHEAVLLRVSEVGLPEESILDLIDAKEWKELDERSSNICVHDPDDTDC